MKINGECQIEDQGGEDCGKLCPFQKLYEIEKTCYLRQPTDNAIIGQSQTERYARKEKALLVVCFQAKDSHSFT